MNPLFTIAVACHQNEPYLRKALESLVSQSLDIVLGGENARRFRRISSRAALPKRLAAPFAMLARCGWQFPAKLFFRRLYYPLAARRAEKRG